MKWTRAVSFSIFCSCLSSLQAMYNLENLLFSKVSLSHREFKGMGFEDGYSSVGLFVSAKPESVILPFLQAKLHIFNDAYLASNLGLGFRFSDPRENLVFGIHTFYDFRNSNNLTSHQASAGIEILGNKVGFRINGYCPVLGKYQEDKVQFRGFQKNQLLVEQKVEYSLPSADAEFSFFLPKPFDQLNLNLALGGYYLFKQKGLFSFQPIGDVPGARVKLEASPGFFFKIGGEYTYDKLFKGRYNGYISFQIPLGRTFFRTRRCLKMQDAGRNEIIPFYTKTYKFSHFNKTKDPYEFTFVSDQETAESLEDGSFENPYKDLPRDLDVEGKNKVVYVLYKEDASNIYDTGYVVQSNQVLASSGASFTLSGVEIPALTPGKLPILTNDNDPAIFAENAVNASIYGFEIQGNNAPAVYAKNSSLTISKNVIKGSLGHPAVHIEDIKEKNIFADNEIYGSLRDSSVMLFENSNDQSSLLLTRNKITALNGENGISFQSVFSDTKLIENIFASEDPSGAALAIFSDELKEQKFLIKNNHFSSGFETAIQIEEHFALSSSFKIAENSFTSKTLAKAIDFSGSSRAFFDITENTFSLFGAGVSLKTNEEAFLSAKVSSNTFHMNAAANAIESISKGKADLDITDNQVEYTSTLGNYSGISIQNLDNNLPADAQIQNNVIDTNAANHAISILNHSLFGTLVIDGNTCKTASSIKGMLIKNSSDGVLQVALTNNHDVDAFVLENASNLLSSFQFLPLGKTLEEVKEENNPNASWTFDGNFPSQEPISD